MPGILDLTPQQLGLLATGLGMLQNSRGRSTGEALGAGGMQGLNAMYQAQQMQQRQALADAQQKRYDMLAQQDERELKRREDVSNALQGINTNDQLTNVLLNNGMISDAIALMKSRTNKTPMGYTQNEKGELVDIPIAGGGTYFDRQMDLARQKAMIPGYGDQERLALAQQAAGLQNQKFMMSLDDQARAQAMFEENMAKVKRENELAQKESQYPKLTEGQSKSTAYASQMASADKEIEAIQAGGFDPTSTASQAQVSLAGGITNPLASAEAQKYRQAQEQWAEAYLRFKTGAAATQGEVDRNIRTFFPQLGDSPEVIKQKEKARQQAFSDISMTTGRGQELLNNRYGEQNKPATTVNISPEASPGDRQMLERIAAEKGVTPSVENKTSIEAEKTIGGKTYIKMGGQWFEQ